MASLAANEGIDVVRKEFEMFAVMVEEKSLSRAADRLDMNQGYLSKMLVKLEREIGAPLFIRSNRGLVPTRNGQKLYEQVQMQLNLWKSYVAHATGAGEEISGLIRIGGHESVLLNYASRLARLKSQFPSLDFEFHFDRSPQINRMVLNHELDLAFVVNPQPFSELVIRTLEREDVAIFSQSSSPCDWVIYNPDLISSGNIIKKHWAGQRRLVPVSNYELVAQLAVELEARAILPSSVASRHRLKNQIGRPFFSADLCLVYRADHRVDPRIAAAVRML